MRGNKGNLKQVKWSTREDTIVDGLLRVVKYFKKTSLDFISHQMYFFMVGNESTS